MNTLYSKLLLLTTLLLASPITAQSENPRDNRPATFQGPSSNNINILGASAYLAGKHRNGFSLNFSRFEYNPKKNSFMDFTLGYEQVSMSTRVDGQLHTYKMRLGQLGFHVYPRIYRDLFLKFGFLFNGGVDTHDYSLKIQTLMQNKHVKKSNSEFVFGGNASQGLTYIPTKEEGITISLSFYQRIATLNNNSFDLGALLSIGVRF